MAYLNANIPVTYAQIRREYLYDLQKHHGEVEDCIIFGMSAITGRSILWHAIMENGAVFYSWSCCRRNIIVMTYGVPKCKHTCNVRTN